MSERQFSISLDGSYTGRYTGRVPAQAARKAFGQICQRLLTDDVSTFCHRFAIKEFTTADDGSRNHFGEEYHYIGTRVFRSDPPVVDKSGNEYIIKSQDTVVACAAPL